MDRRSAWSTAVMLNSVGLVAGSIATVQNYRGQPRHQAGAG